jgi:hypothetical protein
VPREFEITTPAETPRAKVSFESQISPTGQLAWKSMLLLISLFCVDSLLLLLVGVGAFDLLLFGLLLDRFW